MSMGKGKGKGPGDREGWKKRSVTGRRKRERDAERTRIFEVMSRFTS